jgi:hypothetical protein
MASSILQLSLAITPALLAGVVIRRIQFPWDKEKRPSERAELLRLLARDVKRVKLIMSKTLANVNSTHSKPLPRVSLPNWNKVKKDARLTKYAREPIFKEIISQFKEWEQINL